MIEIDTLGIRVAQRSGDHEAQAWGLFCRAETLIGHQQWAASSKALHSALDAARDLRDRRLEAWVLNSFGLLHFKQGRYAEARHCLDHALSLSQELGNERMQAVILGNLGDAYAELGNERLAVEFAEQGLHLRRRIGDEDGVLWALWQFARLSLRNGQHSEAAALCEQALATGASQIYPPNVAGCLDTLGTSHLALGNAAKAISCWQEALVIYDRFADPHAGTLRERLARVVRQDLQGH